MKKQLFFFISFLSISLYSQTWQQITDFPSTERDDACSFVIGNRAYCGTGLKTGWISSKDFYFLNMSTDLWDTIVSLPNGEERQYACGFSDNKNGFVFGGINGSNYLNDLWMYDTLANNWIAKTSLSAVGRMGSCCFVINDIAYIIGGRTSTNSSINEVWAYDITNDSWQQKNNLPFGTRWKASATSINNKGYLIFGKDSSNNIHNTLYEYNPSLDSWSLINIFPNTGRVYSSIINYNNDIFIIAGLDSSNNSYNDMWRYEFSTSTWQQFQNIPSLGRRGGICFTNNNSIYYSTGINQINNRVKETWKVINPTGIIEKVTSKKLIVYPNPANNYFFINSNFTYNNSINIEIIDNTGRVVKSINNYSNSYEVNVSELSSGYYTLKMIESKMTVYANFVVAH